MSIHGVTPPSPKLTVGVIDSMHMQLRTIFDCTCGRHCVLEVATATTSRVSILPVSCHSCVVRMSFRGHSSIYTAGRIPLLTPLRRSLWSVQNCAGVAGPREARCLCLAVYPTVSHPGLSHLAVLVCMPRHVDPSPE